MNKTQLVDALAARLGDRRTAASAVDGVLDIIVDTVGSGGSVTLTGFGVFEARARAARVARNPRTGETVPVPPTTVPAFRPGTAFRTTVAGNGEAAATAKKAPARNPRPATRAVRSSGSFAAEEAVEAPAPKKTARSTAAKATATKAKATEKAPVKAAAKPAAKKTAAKEAVKEAAAKVVKEKPAKKAKAKK